MALGVSPHCSSVSSSLLYTLLGNEVLMQYGFTFPDLKKKEWLLLVLKLYLQSMQHMLHYLLAGTPCRL